MCGKRGRGLLFAAIVFIFTSAIPARAETYGFALQFAQDFPESRFERLIERFTERALGVGFRYLGDLNDFYHGHFLFDGDGHAVAVLYHTQEQAYDHHRRNPGGPYDYLNPETRNWLQWLDPDEKFDGVRIENAAAYILDGQTWNDHYTIYADQLDPEKVGRGLVSHLEVRFEEMSCGSQPEKNVFFNPGGLVFERFPGVPLCLQLTRAQLSRLRYSSRRYSTSPQFIQEKTM